MESSTAGLIVPGGASSSPDGDTIEPSFFTLECGSIFPFNPGGSYPIMSVGVI